MEVSPALHGVERLQAGFQGNAYDWHRHDTYAVGVTLEGVQAFDCRGTGYASLPGQVIVLHPDEPHNGRAGSDTGFGYRMIYLEPSYVRKVLDTPSLPYVPGIVANDAGFARTILSAFESFPQALHELESDALITRLADHLLRRSDARPAPPRGAIPLRSMEVVRAFLDTEFRRPVSSSDLEDLTRLNRYSIARYFRACYGTSPYRYLMMRRLAEAKRLIVQGAPIVTTAIDLGFADQSHLTRAFHRMFGLPPGRFARTLRARAK
jgi:AraC-like DNA-binding protein